MRIQHPPEQPVLRQHVHLIHARRGLPRPLGLLLLAAGGGAADLAQVVVVVHVGEQAPAPDDQADLHVVEVARPVVGGARAVAGQPAADAEAVGDLPEHGAEPDEGVDRRHAGVEDEGGEDGAVEVVDRLRSSVMVQRAAVTAAEGRGGWELERRAAWCALTNMPAIVQLPQGSGSVMPSSSGRVHMMYNSVRKPGISMVNHAHLPGRFHRESVDVLPCGYQSMNH